MTRNPIPDSVRLRISEEAQHRCGYCLSRQDLTPIALEIEHIIPLAKGGSNAEANLWLACRRCNLRKRDRLEGRDPVTGEDVPLFNPRTQKWSEHFQWSDDGILIIGLTSVGRATVIALHLNDQVVTRVRANWVRAGWHPPEE